MTKPWTKRRQGTNTGNFKHQNTTEAGEEGGMAVFQTFLNWDTMED